MLKGPCACIPLVGWLTAPLPLHPPFPCHPAAAPQALEFSPDGSLLASGSLQQQGASLALWATSQELGAAELVAGVQLPGPLAGVAWVPGADPPAFLTAGPAGLTYWQLEPEELACTAVHLPAALRGVPLTAVAVGRQAQAARRTGGGTRRSQVQLVPALVGDGCGRVWRLDIDSGQDVRSHSLLAQLEGQAVTSLHMAGQLACAGAANGTLLLLAAEGGRDQDDSWRVLRCEQLDGAVASLRLDTAGRQAMAATAAGTLWQVAPGTAPQVLLCGQRHPVRSWHMAPGVAWQGAPPAAATASAAGVAVWQLQQGSSGGAARAPLVEFGLPPDATHASLADDASCCAAAYADGSICLFDVVAVRAGRALPGLRWRVAGAAQQGGVAGLAVVQRLRGCKVMVAYRWAATGLCGAVGCLWMGSSELGAAWRRRSCARPPPPSVLGSKAPPAFSPHS